MEGDCLGWAPSHGFLPLWSWVSSGSSGLAPHPRDEVVGMGILSVVRATEGFPAVRVHPE